MASQNTGATTPSEKFSARLSIAARATPASSSARYRGRRYGRPRARPAARPSFSSAAATSATCRCRLRCAIKRAGDERRQREIRTAGAAIRVATTKAIDADDAEEDQDRDNARRLAARLRPAVSRLSERSSAGDQAADPGHRMADRAQQRVADNRRRARSAWPRRASATDMHVPVQRCGRAAAAWRRSRRRPAPVSRRARTFHRPVDRDQSLSLSAAAPCRRNYSPACRMPAATGRARRRRRASLWRAVGGACRAAPGTQILLPLVAGLVRPGRAAVLAPTYAEHARAAALAGHSVVETRDLAALRRCRARHRRQSEQSRRPALRRENALLALAAKLRARGGLLVVDEAFMDVGPPGASLAGDVGRGNVVVLRSFGKFFGLAGVRLGFALAAPPLAARLARDARSMGGVRAGTWPSARRRLADTAWIEATRRRLGGGGRTARWHSDRRRSRDLGGTACSGWCERRRRASCSIISAAPEFWCAISRATPTWLRFGLPAGEEEWRRLQIAMDAFRNNG